MLLRYHVRVEIAPRLFFVLHNAENVAPVYCGYLTDGTLSRIDRPPTVTEVICDSVLASAVAEANKSKSCLLWYVSVEGVGSRLQALGMKVLRPGDPVPNGETVAYLSGALDRGWTACNTITRITLSSKLLVAQKFGSRCAEELTVWVPLLTK